MVIDLNKVKAYLQIEDTSEDTFLQDIIKAVSDIIENYCNRKFTKAEYTERVEGLETLWVKNTPIDNVLEITNKEGIVDFDYDEDKIYLELPKYQTLTGKFRLKDYSEEKYKVVYVGGYRNGGNKVFRK